MDGGSDSAFGMTSTATRMPIGSARRQMFSTLRKAAVRLFSPPFDAGVPMCTTKTFAGIWRAMFNAASASATAA